MGRPRLSGRSENPTGRKTHVNAHPRCAYLLFQYDLPAALAFFLRGAPALVLAEARDVVPRGARIDEHFDAAVVVLYQL